MLRFALHCIALLFDCIAFLCMALLCLALHLLEEALLCLWEGKADTCYGLLCIALHCFAFENRGRHPIDSMHVFFVDPHDADCTLTTKTGTTLAKQSTWRNIHHLVQLQNESSSSRQRKALQLFQAFTLQHSAHVERVRVDASQDFVAMHAGFATLRVFVQEVISR